VVGAVSSPTSELTQVITGYVQIGGPYDYITACSPAGCATMQLLGSIMYYHAFAVEIPLSPGTENPVEVCTYDNCGGSACVRAAVNGEPLIIDQVSAASRAPGATGAPRKAAGSIEPNTPVEPAAKRRRGSSPRRSASTVVSLSKWRPTMREANAASVALVFTAANVPRSPRRSRPAA